MKLSKTQIRKKAINYLRRMYGIKTKNMSNKILAETICKEMGWCKGDNSDGHIIRKFFNILPAEFTIKPKRKKPKKTRNNKPWQKGLEFIQKDAFLKSFEWRRARYIALKNSDGKCQLCGRSSHDDIILNIDHIKPRKTHPELALDQLNLQVLCNECNHGKGNLDDTDWRKSVRTKNKIFTIVK